jgi:hypothetical protein
MSDVAVEVSRDELAHLATDALFGVHLSDTPLFFKPILVRGYEELGLLFGELFDDRVQIIVAI